MKICIHEDCERKSKARNMCLMHYKRIWKKDGFPKDSPLDFLESIKDTTIKECIEYPYYIEDGKYGRVVINGKKVLAHRISLAMKQEIEVPDSNILCLHKSEICHNRKCVNPNHLYWGDKNQNFWDMKKDHKKLPLASLTDNEVRAVRLSSLSPKQISDQYGVSEETIRRIIRGDTYYYVD